MKNKNYLIIIGIIAFVVIIVGISYSYFVYNKDIGDVTLNAGEISIDLSGVSQDQTLTNVIPKSDSEGIVDTNYIDFTVDGTVDSEKIYYEVYIMPDSNNTINTSYIKTYLTDQEDNVIKGVTLYDSLSDSEITGGKRLYREVIEINNDYSKKTYSKDFRLRIWLDEDYPETTSKTFDFDIKLYAKNVAEDYFIPYGSELMTRAISSKTGCTPTWTDPEDNVVYLSGNNTCIDMNYVWYSGKLWRITSIYPDGAMKLVTQNNITAISFNASGKPNFYTDDNTTSYVYQWLNEDFYDTLYHANEFIDTSKQWNATMTADTNISTKPLETNMVTANVGLLNNYEYYNSYRCISSATCTSSYSASSYLNIKYLWWLLNLYSNSGVWYVSNYGDGYNNGPANVNGIRPSIYLKPGLEFTGNGTSSSPYRIVGDKEIGNANDLINTRLSGEYVKLSNGTANQLFRIIGVEDNKTKIISMDYAENKNTRQFATSTGVANTLWGSGTTTGADTWYTYLNTPTTGYLDTLKSTYGELFDSGTYYLGTSEYNYKLSVCANTTSGSTKVCDKTNDKGTFNIGLPRNGEMFATQQGTGYSYSVSMWLMNRHTSSTIWSVDRGGNGSNNSSYGSPTNTYSARPTLHLKSTVKIISGSGTESDPYVVGL